MRIEVWKCARTGALFEEVIDYRRHLCKLAAVRQFKRNRIARLAKADEVLHGRLNLRSFEEIAQWLEDNGRLLLERQLVHRAHEFRMRNTKGKIPKDFEFKDITFSEMRWRDHCSNSHSAPKGKKTNWGGKKGIPTGYPGFRGRIRFFLSGYPDSSSNILDDTAIYTGSGGGGGYVSYDVTLFAEEWPMLTFLLGRSDETFYGMQILEGSVL